MKKILTVFLVFVFVFLMGSCVFAEGNSFDIFIDGKNTDVYSVNLLLDGNRISSECEPFIYKDRTFVPVRVVSEFFDANVDWDQSTKSAIINKDGNTVIITNGSNIAAKNGEKITLNDDQIPMLVSYKNGESKTMIPLRTVSELLGYKVEWINETRTASISDVPSTNAETQENTAPKMAGAEISKIENIKGTSNEQINLIADRAISFSNRYDESTNYLEIEMDDAYFNLDGKKRDGIIDVDGNVIREIEFKSDVLNNKAMMQIELKKSVTPEIKTLENGKKINISFTNKITALKPIIYEGREAILVEGVSDSEFNTMKLKDPFRYVIDIKDAAFYMSNEKFAKYDISMGFINEVRTSQFVPDSNYQATDNIVRIVLDSCGEFEGGDVQILRENGDLIIIPKEEGEKLDLRSDSGMINENRKDDTAVSDNSGNDNNGENIVTKKPRKIPNSKEEVVIVIDAGHGGKDPGATSEKEKKEENFGDELGYENSFEIGNFYPQEFEKVINEKDLNLDVALKTADILRREGYTVEMTRSGDTSLGLYERPKIANNLDAHVFLSIHANSSLNEEASGIETLYAPRDKTTIKMDAQYPLAQLIHKELMKRSRLSDRGIKQRPDLVVLKQTEMPAVLVELGFISNPYDLEIIQTEEFKNDCAEGLAAGITEYINETYFK